MDEVKFKDDFIGVFLATWTANHYDEFCQRGWENWPNILPVEDAGELADEAWQRLLGDSNGHR